MLSFRHFLLEIAGDSPDQPVLAMNDGRDSDSLSLLNPKVEAEINLNLTRELQGCSSPEGGFQKIRKVLAMYGIDVPAIIDLDPQAGEEVLELYQFGGPLDTTVPTDKFLYVCWELSDDGYYDIDAEMTNREGLDELMAEDEDEIE